MAAYDDVRRKVQPIEAPKDANFKTGRKTAQSNVKALGKHSVFNGTKQRNPLDYLLALEKSKRTKNPHKVDPWMVRQAKLKAAKAE